LRRRIVAGLQLVLAAGIVEQFHRGKANPGAAAPATVGESRRPPAGVVVAQDRQANDAPVIQLEAADVIAEHPPAKTAFHAALNLDVYQQPQLASVATPDLGGGTRFWPAINSARARVSPDRYAGNCKKNERTQDFLNHFW
jgi:hypothetical protein